MFPSLFPGQPVQMTAAQMDAASYAGNLPQASMGYPYFPVMPAQQPMAVPGYYPQYVPIGYVPPRGPSSATFLGLFWFILVYFDLIWFVLVCFGSSCVIFPVFFFPLSCFLFPVSCFGLFWFVLFYFWFILERDPFRLHPGYGVREGLHLASWHRERERTTGIAANPHLPRMWKRQDV